jgi:uncharacterized protein involved in exopolysaccharide biosynthesis
MLSYRHADPKVAQSVLTDVVSKFDQANEATRKRAAAEASWLDSQIAEMEGEFAAIGRSTGASASISLAGAADLKTARAGLNAALDLLSDKQYALEQQIAEQQRQISAQRGMVEAAQSAPGTQDAAYGALLVRKAELESQALDYSAQYTNKNDKVIQNKNQLQEINRQLAALESKNQSPGVAAAPAIRELLALERELVRLQTDLRITERETQRKTAALESLPKTDVTPSGQKVISETETKVAYDRLVNRYNLLQQQRDLVQKASALDSETPLIRISDPPNLPHDPVTPNRLMLRGLALGLALGTGLLAGAIVEVRRFFLVHDSNDVAYFLEMPVLGVIPETLTPVERRVKRLDMFSRALAVVLLVSSVPAAVLVLKHFDLLKKVLILVR